MGSIAQRVSEFDDGPGAFGEPHWRVQRGADQLDAIARSLEGLGPPVVVFCASHSGSRLLAALLRRLGVFMGADLTESEDSLALFDLVRYLVEAHAPDFSCLLENGDSQLPQRVRQAFLTHLAGRPSGQRWGWKLPETGHVLPVMARLFPQARFIHLVRDGRDVAFSPFLAPKAPFWRKIYFGSDEIRTWNGFSMTQRAYKANSHVFNAARWVNSVSLGRAHGVMLGERFLEVRFEALLTAPEREIRRVAAFLDIDAGPAAEEFEVKLEKIGKWRRRTPQEIKEIRSVLEPTLSSFGYRWDQPSVIDTALGRFMRQIKRLQTSGGGVSAGQRTEPGGLGGLFRVRDRR